MMDNKLFEVVILSSDETKVRALRNLLSNYYTLNISKICSTSAEAIEYLNHNRPTVIFLDIEFAAVLHDVRKPPFIIGLCDAIYTKKVKQFLKMGFFEVFYAPYSESELNGIMGKILNIYCAYNKVEKNLVEYVEERNDIYRTYPDSRNSLFLMGTRNEESTRIFFDNVLYISKSDEYVDVHFEDGSIKSFRSNLKMFHKKFPASKFVKINRMVVVNVDKITSVYNNNMLKIGDAEFEITRSFIKSLKATLAM